MSGSRRPGTTTTNPESNSGSSSAVRKRGRSNLKLCRHKYTKQNSALVQNSPARPGKQKPKNGIRLAATGRPNSGIYEGKKGKNRQRIDWQNRKHILYVPVLRMYTYMHVRRCV